MKGKKTSEETKKKMSEGRKGEKAYWYGKKMPKEAVEKMRKASTGRKASRETREKISASGKKRYIEKGNPNKGLKRSDEYKKKQSKLLKEIYKDNREYFICWIK
jgi:hypothetical protein